MKFSDKIKNRILKQLLKSEINTTTYDIEDICSLLQRCKFASTNELIQYLHVLEWEHLIDTDIRDNKIISIHILPNAFSRYSAIKSDSLYKNITLAFAALSTICTVIQVIDLFLRVRG